MNKEENAHTVLPVFVCGKCGLKVGASGYALCPTCRRFMVQSENEEMAIEHSGEKGVIGKRKG